LLPSHSVEIAFHDRRSDQDLSLKTVIESGYTDDTFRVVAPYYDGMIYNFHANDKVEVVFTALENDQKIVYALPCVVERRLMMDDLALLSLRGAGEPKKIQRRQAFRLKIYNTYEFEYRGRSFELVTKDISSTGMLALTTIPLHAGDYIEILFDANTDFEEDSHEKKDPSKVFPIRCRVLDSVPELEIRRYLSRIHFENLTSVESKMLYQYLYAKQTEFIHKEPDSNRLLRETGEVTEEVADKTKRMHIQIISLVSIGLLVLSGVLFLYAQPTPLYPLDRFFGFYRTRSWQLDYLYVGTGVCFLTALLSVLGLYINQGAISESGKGKLSRVLIVTLTLAMTAILLNLYFISVSPALLYPVLSGFVF
jgi:c-di-GMP-binding flagellar brake protein YcgR